jgi:hypothetical protein
MMAKSSAAMPSAPRMMMKKDAASPPPARAEESRQRRGSPKEREKDTAESKKSAPISQSFSLSDSLAVSEEEVSMAMPEADEKSDLSKGGEAAAEDDGGESEEDNDDSEEVMPSPSAMAPTLVNSNTNAALQAPMLQQEQQKQQQQKQMVVESKEANEATSKAPPVNPHLAAGGDYLSLIKAQASDGSWTLDQVCGATKLAVSKADISKSFSETVWPEFVKKLGVQEVSGALSAQLATFLGTALALVVLERCFPHKKSEWSILSMKARTRVVGTKLQKLVTASGTVDWNAAVSSLITDLAAAVKLI